MTRGRNALTHHAYRIGIIVLAAATALLAVAAAGASAGGGGGTTIASAPAVSPGTQVTGDTATDPTAQASDSDVTGCWDDLEYWRVPLTVGDKVKVAGNALSPAYNTELGVFPVGTTDASIHTTAAIKTVLLSHVPMTFTATATGSYPIVVGPNCYNGVDGPFDFTVSVTHEPSGNAATVKLPKLTHLAPSGVLTAMAHTSDGTPITDSKLVLELHGTWGGADHLLAKASPSKGSARFAFHVPASLKGTTVALRVTAPATDYKPVSSAALRVRIG
ncbi:MAG TPA: hypothetical protein VH063_12610 [Gaiellaceae bacterium]|jgi:hypothetical protein|nr:hypothetical protein [Gaiellaceae bacterium]